MEGRGAWGLPRLALGPGSAGGISTPRSRREREVVLRSCPGPTAACTQLSWPCGSGCAGKGPGPEGKCSPACTATSTMQGLDALPAEGAFQLGLPAPTFSPHFWLRAPNHDSF